jgi:hypothetical protein
MRTLHAALKLLALSAVSLTFLTGEAGAGFWNKYPKDGKFKQLASEADMWYYVDEERWLIRAPDKWQHFMGSYLSQKLMQEKIGKWKAALMIASMGALKEFDDGFREGWSPRDLLVNHLGILGALASGERVKFTSSYDTEKFVIKAHVIF